MDELVRRSDRDKETILNVLNVIQDEFHDESREDKGVKEVAEAPTPPAEEEE